MELVTSLLAVLLVLTVTQVGDVQAAACNTFADEKFGPVCPFDCSNCGAVTCRDNDYVCLTGYCYAVNGPAGPQGCAFEDIARGGKNMAQISTYNNFGPYRAGNRMYATDVLSACTHTGTGVSYPWFRVDFGSQHVVYAVQLYNRIHSSVLDRLSFFDVRVGNTDIETAITAGQKFNGNQLCKTYNQRVPETLTATDKPYSEILCDQPRRGRYLSIQMNEGNGISRSSGYNKVLSICEISIRGYEEFGSGGRTGNGDCWCRDGNECDMAGVCNSGCKLVRYGEYCHNVIALETPTLSAYSPTTVKVQWKLFNSNQLTLIDSNRGSVPLSYLVQYKSGSGTWQDFPGQGSIMGSGSNQFKSLTLTGLRADTQYQIRSVLVKTYNGNAEVAARSTAVTRCAALPKPSQIQASPQYDGTLPHPNQCKATVNWAADTGDDCMVLQFRVDYTPTNGQKVSSGVLSGVTRSLIISSLKCYTDYEVRVVAMEGSAESESEPYAFKTPEGKPDRVSSLTITPSSNSAVLSWSAPTPHGVLSQYQIIYRRFRYLAGCLSNDQTKYQTVAAGTTTYTVTGLSSYSEYQFSVTAYTNNNQNKGLTTWQTKQTTTKAPPRPTITKIQSQYVPRYTYPNTVKITVEWSQPAPEAAECMTITNHVHFRQSGKVLPSIDAGMNSRVLDIPDLVPYTDYDVRVEARTGQGVRSFTGWKPHRTAEGLSGPVTSLSVSPSVTSVNVSWGEPVHPYGVIASYRVSFARQSYLAGCSNNPGHSGSVDADDLSHTLTGLSPFSRYAVRVAAINGAGPGRETVRDINTLDTVPDQAVIPSEAKVKDISAESASVQFHDVSCEQKRGLFKQYNYQLSDLSYDLSSRSGSVVADQLSLSDLTPFTNYSIRYNWENQKGATLWSSRVVFQTLKSVPPAPTIKTDSGRTFITVSVTPPYPPHDYLTAVSVTCRVDNDASLSVHRDMTILVNSNASVAVPFFESEVKPARKYICWAVVKSADRTSDKSREAEIFTLDAQASAPRLFEVLEVTRFTVRLAWTSPENKNGIISKYQYWCKAEKTKNPSRKSSLPTASELEFSLNHQYAPIDVKKTHETEPISGLWSATEYRCHVRAINGWGEGKATSTTFWTRAEKIDPVDAKLTYDVSESDEDSVQLILPIISSTVAEIERYRVVVELTENVRRKRSTVANLTFAEAEDKGSNTYIAAEWNSYRETFVVGDGSSNNGYYNAPLIAGETYIILYGVASVVDRMADFIYLKLGKPITVGQYADETPASKGNLLPYIGAGVGAVLVIIVAIIAAVIVCRYRRRKQEQGQPIHDIYEMDTGTVNEAAEYAEVRELSSAGPGTVPPVKRYAGSGRGYDPQALLQIVQELTYRPRGFTEEFQGLPRNELSKDAATRPENKQKNRSGGVLPYDHSRVKLGESDVAEQDDIADYINASWIEDFTGRRSYIATQAPLLKNTETNFWNLIWDKEVKVIVMLTAQSREEEGLCAQYWPAKVGEVAIFAGMNIALHAEQNINSSIIKRDLVFIKGGVMRNITQLQYAGWPDQGVPALCAPLLQLRAAVREAAQPDSLTLVHCSHGSGRTGAFIAVDDVLCQHREMGTFNVKDTIQRLLHCRDRMIETDRQFTFVHHCLLEGLLLEDTSILKSELLQRLQGKEPSTLEYKVMDLMRQARFETNSIGSAKPNQYKNRNPDIIPDDLHRPTLLTQRRENCYINACFVKNLSGSPELLVTQLPLANTVTDLWQLVWDQEINTIVRLDTNKKRMKPGEQYWPTQDRTDTGAFTITFDRRDSTNIAYTVETFKLSKGTSTPRAVGILVFQAWPDNSPVPEFPLSFLHLYQALKTHAADAPTALVQCYDGATKSGLLCATYCLLEALSEQESVSIYQAVRLTQHTRPQFIPEMKQYAFLHAVACEFMEQAAEEIYSTYMEPTYIQKPDDYINFSQT